MKEYTDKMDLINSKDDFAEFIMLLLEDLKNNPNSWENKTLPEYLEAMANWVQDSDGYYKNFNLPIPTNVNWKAFANVLAAAVVYE